MHGRAGTPPPHRVHHRLFQVQQERVTELVGFRLVRLVAARAAPVDLVTAEPVAREVREDVAERLVGDLADRARGELEVVVLAFEIAGVLERLRHLAQPRDVVRRLRTQQLLHLLGRDAIEVREVAHPFQLALELVEAVHLVHELHRLLEADVLVTAERIALRHLLHRQELGEMHGELRHRGFEALVAHEERAGHVVELLALAGRHALHERLHLRHLPAQLVQQIVEALRVRELVAPLLLEGVEVRLPALGALAQHAVQILQHLA